VLNRLHVEGDAVDFFQLRLKAANQVARVNPSLFKWLKVYQNTAAVQGRIRSINANERRDILDRGVFQNHLCQCLLALDHRGKRNALRRFRDGLYQTSVLYGKESLWHDDV